MSGIVRAAASYVTTWIPEWTDRQILFSSLLLWITQIKSKGREEFTLVKSLEESSTATAPYIQWLKQTYTPEVIQEAIEHPEITLLKGHLKDLTSRVFTVAAYFFTFDLSLYASLTHLISQSEKIAEVAQPLLKRLDSIPVIPRLLSTRVMILSPLIPIVAHAIFIGLSYLTNGKNGQIEWLKHKTGLLNRWSEALLNLRFAVLCLNLSKTILQSLGFTICSLAINKLLPAKYQQMKRILTLFLPELFKADYFPTTGFGMALDALYSNMQSFLTPFYSLRALYEKQSILVGLPSQNLKDAKQGIEKALKFISELLENNSITQLQAEGLKKDLAQKGDAVLKDFISRSPEEGLKIQGVGSLFHQIYGPGGLMAQLYIPEEFMEQFHSPIGSDWNYFCTCLQLVKEATDAVSSKNNILTTCQTLQEAARSILSSSSTEDLTKQQATFFKQFLYERMTEFYDKVISPKLINSLSFLAEQGVETALRSIYGKEGLLDKLASSEENHYFNQLSWTIFAFKLSLFKDRPPNDNEKAENILDIQALSDGVYKILEELYKDPACKSFVQQKLEELPKKEHSEAELHQAIKSAIQAYIAQSAALKPLREILFSLNKVEFKTHSFGTHLKKLQQDIGIPEDDQILDENIPPEGSMDTIRRFIESRPKPS